MIRRDDLQAAASGLLLAAALPNEFIPYGSPLLAVPALVPLFYALLRSKGTRDSVRVGVIFAVISTALSNYWLANFGEFAVWTIGGPILGYAVYNALLFPVLRRLMVDRRGGRRVFLAAAAWAAYEYFKSVGFLGYPWGLISYPAGVYLPLIQHVDITGVWALSFLFAAINMLGAELLYRRDAAAGAQALSVGHERIATLSAAALRPALVFCAVILLAMLGYGWYALGREVPTRAEMQLVMVQNNTDSWERGNEEPSLLVAQRLSRRGIRALEPAQPDLVVWSETVLRRPYEYDRVYYTRFPSTDPLASYLKESMVPLLTGGPHIVPDGDGWLSYNAALLIGPDGELRGVYGKRQLVPFAENIPFWEFAAVRRFFREVIGIHGTWTPGPEITVFELPLQNREAPLLFATPICFEDAFSGVIRSMVREGAEVLINLTNNSWSQTNSAQTQHFVAAQFRAVEMRTTLIRSSNSGLSTIVDPHGRRVIELPMFEQQYFAGTVKIQQSPRPTVYTLWGDYLAWAFLCVVFAGLVRGEYRNRRAQRVA